ncbi:MAG TPA: hypothetical protein VK203_27590 [Nostocaceae cyanobacterium]|nr:hypothetical protein [Nostocaceae cyanobacterium]
MTQLCCDCPFFTGHGDGTDKGWCGLFDRMARESHRMTIVCEQEFEAVVIQEAAQQELEQELEAQVSEVAPEPDVDIREERAKTVEVVKVHGDQYTVFSNGNYYVVKPNEPLPQNRCECGDCYFRKLMCKHQIAVKNYLATKSNITAECINVDTNEYAVVYELSLNSCAAGEMYLDYNGSWYHNLKSESFCDQSSAIRDFESCLLELSAQ